MLEAQINQASIEEIVKASTESMSSGKKEEVVEAKQEEPAKQLDEFVVEEAAVEVKQSAAPPKAADKK